MADQEHINLRATLLAQAIREILGDPYAGFMAYIRCLTPDAVDSLASNSAFAPTGWQVFRVADESNQETRTITGDEAVEMREAKGDATLLLVNTGLAGAGMDGIYSALREVDEGTLFQKARPLVEKRITSHHSADQRHYAKQAVKKAQRHAGLQVVSPWVEFDFLCQVASGERTAGAYLHCIGLWPVKDSEIVQWKDSLEISCMFVDRLLGIASAPIAPAVRIEALNLENDAEARNNLERFLQSVDTHPLFVALAKLAEEENLWIGALRPRGPAESLREIELSSWRNRNRTIAKWSGLIETDPNEPPELVLPEGDGGKHSPLVIKWKSDPVNLVKHAVEYRVSVMTDMNEEVAAKIVPHAALRGGERCRFDNEDFAELSEEARVPAKVVVSVVGIETVTKESEDFLIRRGRVLAHEPASSLGMKVRTLSEGLVELDSREEVSSIVASMKVTVDSKGNASLRTPAKEDGRKSYRVFQPPLIHEVEKDWIDQGGKIGRWIVKVHGSGSRAGQCEFEPCQERKDKEWERAVKAAQQMAMRFRSTGAGGVAQVYDEAASSFSMVQEYLRAWAALLETEDPSLAIANTIEVRTLSGRTIGLIVLPAHPLRVAWLAAYDNLVLHTAFEQGQKPNDIRREFMGLDSAMFPAFLPNPNSGAFVFADTLGFHAIGMVPDSDKEPKAAVAILAHALGGGADDTAPTVGSQSAKVLSNEIVKYLECHQTSHLLHLHALRAGDGLTIARSLGNVCDYYLQEDRKSDGDLEEQGLKAPVFSLDLYPSFEQRGIAGRFITEACEKRRSGAGMLAPKDRWMLESLRLPGDVNMPRLRWARKEPSVPGKAAEPETAAHLAVAFDTFESEVRISNEAEMNRPASYYAFGLSGFYERRYDSLRAPQWISTIPMATEGEKHPSRRVHTEMLMRLQNAIQCAVARHLGDGDSKPILKTEISPEKADGLKKIHRLCDWVVTLDRNAGIEYFDSPIDNKDIYDAYVIDCVPEREDLGCLQLITSTANLDEVRNLLDYALDQMGLSRSRRNAEFLIAHLKALSGRLAIRLTGNKPATSELIALALSQAYCCDPPKGDECWMSLKDGFIVPIDDVQDLLPPINNKNGETCTRPDLVYVSASRSGLAFQFIEVKYRRDLRSARSPSLLNQIEKQVQRLRHNWNDWYGLGECMAFRAIRRAKLARVLRFYVDKALRHYMPKDRHAELVAEIDRMIAKGSDYAFGNAGAGDRGWIFCPEYMHRNPLRISPDDWETQIFLVGPALLPDIYPHVSKNATSATKQSPQNDLPLQRDSELPLSPDRSNSIGSLTNFVPSISLGKDAFTNTQAEWSLTVRGNPHLLVAGLPGMGKTTCLLNLCRQMIAANIRPIIFSYHQDIDKGLQQSNTQIRFVDFDSLGFNPLQVIDRRDQTAYLDVAGTVRDIFSAIYPQIGDIQADQIRKAIKESFLEAGWGEQDTSSELREPPFRRFVEILRSEPKPNTGLRNLLARLDELDDYRFFKAGDPQPSLWDSDQPTVIRIHAKQNDDMQRAFSSLVFYRLYKDMFQRGIQDRITHALIFDEAHRASRLKLIPTMAKECRKYGISLVLASQQAADFNPSLFSAIANYLILRLTDADARFLVRNVSSSQQEKALVDKLKQMKRFRALYFSEGETRPRSVQLHSEEDSRICTAIKLLQMGGLSTGAAAERAGVSKSFLSMKLEEHGIDTFNLSSDEFRRDLDSARRRL